MANYFDTLRNQLGTTVGLSLTNYLTGSKINAPQTSVALNPNLAPVNMPANQVFAPATTLSDGNQTFFQKYKYVIIGAGALVGVSALVLIMRR